MIKLKSLHPDDQAHQARLEQMETLYLSSFPKK